jgi:hypothetical protein
MRYRKGARSILDGWTGEEKDLLEKVKKKWKGQAVIHHEASGGDPEQWKNVNSLYSAILKKIVRKIRAENQDDYIIYDCIICGVEVKKKIINEFRDFQLQSKLCKNSDCHRKHHNNKSRKRLSLMRLTRERYCLLAECQKRFFTTDRKRKFCSEEHRILDTNKRRKNYKKIKGLSWKEKWAKLSPEEQERRKIRHCERQKQRQENETPEQREIRLKKAAEAQRNRTRRLTPEQKAAEYANRKKYNLTKEQQIEKKREQWKDKPWMFETWLQEIGPKKL